MCCGRITISPTRSARTRCTTPPNTHRHSSSPSMNRNGIGQAVRRVEDQRFLTGRARYVADIQLPHMLHGAVVMSPHAHARIRAIDVKAALASPGVHLVLTGADAQAEKLGGIPPLFM